MSHLGIGQFYGEIHERFVARGLVLTRLEHARGRRLPFHTHGAPYYALLIRGGYRERWRGGELDYGPLTLVFHPPETSHVDEIAESGGLFYTIELEQSWIDRVRDTGPVIMPRVGVQDPALVWLALRLYREQLRGEISPLLAESMVLELLSRTMNVRGTGERATPPWLNRVVDLLHANFADPISVNALASEAGVHPVHLTRVFRRHFGMTIGEYARGLRIEFAARALAQGESGTLADVASAAGFADQSHFCRICRRLTGSTPGELAKLLRSDTN